MDLSKDKKLIRIKNLLSMLGRGKWELQGDEILAFAQAIEFVLDLEKEMKSPPQPIEVKEPIKEQKAVKKPKKEKVNAI